MSTDPLYLIQDLAVILVSAIVAAAVCKRLNLSPVVGYLIAGIVVGTPQITFVYVTDAQRVHLLSQLGLIFLMFSIGTGFRIQRFKQLGLGTVVACVTTSLLVLTISRLAADWAGLSPISSLFFAAMLMVSSSAVIGKSLQSQGLTHQRFAQLALGITLCEDIVAIVLLTILGSYGTVDSGASGPFSLASQIGVLLAFVALLLLPGVLFVPRVLKKISLLKHDSEELQTVFVCALLFGMALITLISGYSLALGSFLSGVIVAESTRTRQIGHAFSGLRDLFVAVFFVAIGMNVDITQFGESIELIVLGTALALVARPIAAALGLLITCEQPQNAIKAGLSVSPIGEFSFVIANLGVTAGVLDARFRVAAVGIAFLTAILSPWFIQRNESIGRRLNIERFAWVRNGLASYNELWSSFLKRQDKSFVWKLIRPRIPQLIAEILFASAIIVFASPVYELLIETGNATFASDTFRIGYWIVVAILALSPTVALARNINALSMLVGEAMTHNLERGSNSRNAIIILIRGVGLAILALWLVNLIPFDWVGPYGLGAIAIAVVAMISLGWRSMVRLHSHATYSISQVVNQSSPTEEEERSLRQVRVDWGIELEEMTVAAVGLSGRSIGELRVRERTGASIVGIERHGHYLPSVGPVTHLFVGDRVFATGSAMELAALRQLLSEEVEDEVDSVVDFHSAVLESVAVPSGSPCHGATLRTLNWPRLIGVQIAAIRKPGAEPRHPKAEDVLDAGDVLLLVGAPSSLTKAKEALAPR